MICMARYYLIDLPVYVGVLIKHNYRYNRNAEASDVFVQEEQVD